MGVRWMAALLTAGLLAGCASGGHSTGRRSGTVTSAQAHGCSAAQLDAKLRTLRTSGIGEQQVLVIRNSGRGACRLSGAPRVLLLDGSGRVLRREPLVVADHRSGISLAPGGVASVWLYALSAPGTQVRGVKQVGFAIHGVPGRLMVDAPSADRVDQQLIVSYIASGRLTRLPPSTALPPTCGRLVLEPNLNLGAYTSHSVEAIVLVNASGEDCTVGGIPKLSVSNPDGTPRYRIPEVDVGPAAKVVVGPHGRATALAIYPACQVFGAATNPPNIAARNTVKLPGIASVSGAVTELQATWPTRYCKVIVSGLASGDLFPTAGSSTT